MCFIPTTTKATDPIPEGMVSKKCTICGNEYLVPEGTECYDVCEACKSFYEAQQAKQDATNASTQSEIDKALGK